MTAEMGRAWVGVDPGAAGAMALLTEHDYIDIKDWSNFGTMNMWLRFWGRNFDVQCVAVEKLHGRKGSNAESTSTFMKHVGGWLAVIEVLGLPCVEVRPQIWMMRRVPVKKSKTDKPSVKYVQKRYPDVELFGPRGGVKDGRSDALCMAEWAREQTLKEESKA